MEIANKIVLVTGGANGIGFAYVTELLRNGAAHVSILDLPNSNGEEVAKKFNDEFGKGKTIFVICDVTKPQELEAGFARTVEKFGGLDIVINNAGIMDDSRWELEININYNAVVRGTLLGLQYMGKDRGGKGGLIVNVASNLGLMPMSVFPVYCGTKHAVVGFSRSFGQPYHYEKTGVRVLTMCPSLTLTQLITENVGRTLDIISQEAVDNVFASFPPQPATSVAQGMLHIIRVGENGSVWVAEGAEPIYEVEIPDQPVKKNAVVRGTLLGFQNMGQDKGGKGGVIVNVASILGVTPLASAPIYTGLKHAVIGFSRSFGLPYHYQKTGVRVLAICPGFTKTQMTAAPGNCTLGILDPETIAAELKDFAWQTVESVAPATVFIIQTAQNGSVWISEGAEPVYEISIPDRQAMKIATLKDSL